MKSAENTFLIRDREGITKNIVSSKDIAGLIERQACIRIESYEDALFSSGKIEESFFTYLVIMIEDYYDVAFPDDLLETRLFDSVEKIVWLIESVRGN